MWNINIKLIADMKNLLKQCWRYRNEDEFKRLVLAGYQNPNLLELKKYGNEYPERIIYHIGAFGCSVGFFAEFLYALIRLYFATDRGLVPYIDWGKEFLYYEENGVDNEYNGFLYYFEPVSDVCSIKKASYVLEATNYQISDVQNRCLHTYGYAVTDEYMDALSDMIKKYIRYNEKTKVYLESGYDQLIGGRKALAVHFRGTDYRRQYNNHPVFVTIEQEIEEVRKLIKTKDYEVIFLATDEQDAVVRFRQEFGDLVKCFEDTWRANGGDESVAYSHSDRKNHHYLLGLEVIRDQYMLTRCAGLVCGISNLTLSARMMRRAWYSQDYEDLVIVNHDLCHNERNFCDANH